MDEFLKGIITRSPRCPPSSHPYAVLGWLRRRLPIGCRFTVAWVHLPGSGLLGWPYGFCGRYAPCLLLGYIFLVQGCLGGLMVSVDVTHHVYCLGTSSWFRAAWVALWFLWTLRTMFTAWVHPPGSGLLGWPYGFCGRYAPCLLLGYILLVQGCLGGLMVSVDVTHHVYCLGTSSWFRAAWVDLWFLWTFSTMFTAWVHLPGSGLLGWTYGFCGRSAPCLLLGYIFLVQGCLGSSSWFRAAWVHLPGCRDGNNSNKAE